MTYFSCTKANAHLLPQRVLLFALCFGLTACSFKTPQSKAKAAHQKYSRFSVLQVTGDREWITQYDSQGHPHEKLYHLRACLVDTGTLRPIAGQAFSITGGKAQERITDASGCLTWLETASHDYGSQRLPLKVSRQFRARDLYRGDAEEVSLAFLPWHAMPQALIDLRYQSIPEILRKSYKVLPITIENLLPTKYETSGAPEEVTYALKACLVDADDGHKIADQIFKFDAPTTPSITTDAAGCFIWNEKIPYNRKAQQVPVSLIRKLSGNALYEGEQSLPLAMLPWNDKSGALIDLRTQTAPEKMPRFFKALPATLLWQRFTRFDEHHFPIEKTYSLKTCLLDTVTLRPVPEQLPFRVSSGTTDTSVNTHGGCITWTEVIPYSRSSQRNVVELQPTITPVGGYENTQNLKLGFLPWLNSNDSFVDLNHQTLPAHIPHHFRALPVSAYAQRFTRWNDQGLPTEKTYSLKVCLIDTATNESVGTYPFLISGGAERPPVDSVGGCLIWTEVVSFDRGNELKPINVERVITSLGGYEGSEAIKFVLFPGSDGGNAVVDVNPNFGAPQHAEAIPRFFRLMPVEIRSQQFTRFDESGQPLAKTYEFKLCLIDSVSNQAVSKLPFVIQVNGSELQRESEGGCLLWKQAVPFARQGDQTPVLVSGSVKALAGYENIQNFAFQVIPLIDSPAAVTDLKFHSEGAKIPRYFRVLRLQLLDQFDESWDPTTKEPNKRGYRFQACVRDVTSNKEILDHPFRILVDGKETPSISREGCLVWTEVIDYQFFVQETKKLHIKIMAESGYDNAAEFDVALVRTNVNPATEALLDLRYFSLPSNQPADVTENKEGNTKP